MSLVVGRRDAVDRSVLSSELSKHPAEVFAAAEAGPVEVTRRDGEPLVLMTKHEADLNEAVLRAAAQLIAVSLDESGSLTDRLAVHFPWIRLLSDADQRQCGQSIIDSARSAFSMYKPALFITELHAWESTAEAVAAGWDRDEIEWLGEHVTVQDPREA